MKRSIMSKNSITDKLGDLEKAIYFLCTSVFF